MYFMFFGASAFNQDVSDWDTSAVTDMTGTFADAHSFNQDLSSWDIAHVTDMSFMLAGVTLSTSNYDALLNGWAAQSVRPSVTFSGGTSQYSSVGSAARAALAGGTNNWTITDGGQCALCASGSPASVAFAAQEVGTTSVTQSVTFTSTGSASLTIGASAASMTGSGSSHFAITADTCSSSTLAPAASCTVTVRFAPSAPSPATAAIALASNAPASPATVAVSGTGTTAPAPSGGSGSSATYSITLNTNGGTCSSSSLSGAAGSWVTLPSASTCTKSGFVLEGWSPPYSSAMYLPGASLSLAANTRLTAVWATDVNVAGGTTGAGSRASAVRVIWTARNGKLRAGDTSTLASKSAVFTIATSRPRRVNAGHVTAAKALAARYGGTYVGVTTTRTWKAPRIVAAYSG